MLKQKVFQIAVIFAAFMIISLTVHSGEPCNRSTDVDSGIGANTGAFGHAEVLDLGFWRWWDIGYYTSVTLYGYVENRGMEKIHASILYDYRVIELNENFNFKHQWYAPPIEVVADQLDPGESLMPSSYTNGLKFRGGKWLEGLIVRAETMIKVEATTGKRGAQTDEWFAWGCVDKEFD